MIKGWSLVEMLIGLFLGVLLLTILINHFLWVKKLYGEITLSLQQALELKIVENFIREKIKRAGFTPCLKLNGLIFSKERNNKLVSPPIKENYLSLVRMSEHFSQTVEITSHAITISPALTIRAKDFILIADCYHAEVRQVVFSKAALGNLRLELKDALHFSYTPPIYVGKWIKEEFFIKKNLRGVDTLYYRNGHAEELSSLINKFSINWLYYREFRLLQVMLTLADKKTLMIEMSPRSS